jgi:predicted RNA-binding Zn ribbon-like protein
MPESLDPPWPSSGSAGSLAIDFVNTVDWRGRARPDENLHAYRDLLRWGLAHGAVDRDAARRLLAWSEAHPGLARRALERAIAMRESLAALFQAVARGRPAPPAAIARLEEACRSAWEARRLVATPDGARWAWREADPDRPARAAALDAERLLVAADRPPLKECAGEDCGWLFLDTSRTRRRRWCSMESCGNRAKARRFYERARRGTPPPE